MICDYETILPRKGHSNRLSWWHSKAYRLLHHFNGQLYKFINFFENIYSFTCFWSFGYNAMLHHCGTHHGIVISLLEPTKIITRPLNIKLALGGPVYNTQPNRFYLYQVGPVSRSTALSSTTSCSTRPTKHTLCRGLHYDYVGAGIVWCLIPCYDKRWKPISLYLPTLWILIGLSYSGLRWNVRAWYNHGGLYWHMWYE